MLVTNFCVVMPWVIILRNRIRAKPSQHLVYVEDFATTILEHFPKSFKAMNKSTNQLIVRTFIVFLRSFYYVAIPPWLKESSMEVNRLFWVNLEAELCQRVGIRYVRMLVVG